MTTTLVNAVRPCVRCGRPTRPLHSKKADYPGTTIRTHGLCDSCSRVSENRPCVRCGILRTAGGNTAVLCRDCRSVLTKEEVAAWAA